MTTERTNCLPGPSGRLREVELRAVIGGLAALASFTFADV
jgi:hypothetical protein